MTFNTESLPDFEPTEKPFNVKLFTYKSFVENDENFPESAKDTVPDTFIVFESAVNAPFTTALFVSNIASNVERFANTKELTAALPVVSSSSNCALLASKNLTLRISCPSRFNADNIVASLTLSDGTRHKYSVFPRLTDVVPIIPFWFLIPKSATFA